MKTLLANLVRKIEEFAGSLEFASELTRAKKQFFAPVGAPGENGANAEVELSNFIEWFVFNWSLPDGLNVWAKYLRFQGTEHTPEELDLLKQMDHQIYSLFLVKKDKPGKEAVADIVTGKKYQPVHELSAGLHRGDYFVGRLMLINDGYFFTEALFFIPKRLEKIFKVSAKMVRKSKLSSDVFVEELRALAMKSFRYPRMKLEELFK